MKKLIISILLIIVFTSCGYHTPMSESVKFEVVDTLEKYESDFQIINNYFVIIKIDSSFYSAKINENVKLYEIVRKLKATE